jgi:4'-phosphopantetheinyl transferase
VTPTPAALDGRVEVWLLRTDPSAVAGLAEAWWALLDEDDRQRATRLLRPADRERSVLAHGLLRRCLSRYAPVKPACWRFRRDEHGRPWVAAPDEHGLCFGLSHCPGLTAVLVCRHPCCGVDVERLGATRDPLLVARHVCTAHECAALEACDGEERQRAFTARWTLKEAWAKARGRGQDLPFDQAGFRIGSDGAVCASFAPALDRADRWRFDLLAPTEEHLLAVAVGDGLDLALRVRWDSGEPPG